MKLFSHLAATRLITANLHEITAAHEDNENNLMVHDLCHSCMACIMDVDGKIISINLQDGRISSKCVCPAIVSDFDGDGLPELAQPIYAQVVLEYFKNWELQPAIWPISDNGIAKPAEKFRPDELQIIAAALEDLPAPTGQSRGIPLTQTEYMTHTRGIVIQHLMSKIYAKHDLDLETRIQGALDETHFRHNLYFILETLFQVEQEIRGQAKVMAIDPDFSMLNNFHVESSGVTIPNGGAVSNTATLNWRHSEMTGNTADILSQTYMEQILNGLGDDTAYFSKESIKFAVLEHYDEIFIRTSELSDCLNKDTERVISWICDERIPEEQWKVCAAADNDNCWLALMNFTCSIEEAMADNQDLSNTSACACDRFDFIQCRADATLLIDDENWKWGSHNSLFAAYNRQWMMDMANFYSTGEGNADYIASGGVTMTQAEICALDQAFTAALGAGVAGAPNGADDFRNAYNQVVNFIKNGNYCADFVDKIQGIINAAQIDGRDDELNWLMDTVTDLSGGYQWDWNGQAADGEGHGSPQMNELLNLMNRMRNGGDWNVLGVALDASGAPLDLSKGLTEDNDGTGGIWSDFDEDAYDSWITDSLNQDIMGADWATANTGVNSRYQKNFNQGWGWRPSWRPTTPTGPPNLIKPNVPDLNKCEPENNCPVEMPRSVIFNSGIFYNLKMLFE